MDTYRKHQMYVGQISLLLFELVGICKPLTWNSGLKVLLYNTYSIFMITIVFIFVFSILIYILQNAQNIDSEMETFYYFLALANSFNKLFTIFLQRKTVIKSNNLFMNNICRPRDAFETNILQQTSHSCRLYTILYVILMNLTALSVIMFPPSKRSDFPLPIKVWIPYNLNSRTLYLLTYIHQGIAAVLAACVTAAVDSLALMIILQICAQYEILIHRLKLLPELATRNNFKSLDYQCESKIVSDCVKLHIHIFSIGDNLNKLFGSMIFVQIFSSMISLCPITYQLTKLSLNDPKCWGLIFLLVSTLLQIFLYSFFGEKVMAKSLAFLEGIYGIQWLSITNRTKRDLILIMIRASRPMQFMGLKLIVMSIETFVQIVKSAYSAYNLLKGY